MVEQHTPDFEVRLGSALFASNLRQRTTSLSFQSDLQNCDSFTMTLADPDMRLLGEASLQPGNRIELHMGYAHRLERMMVGEIVSLQPDFPASGAPTLTIRSYDLSHRLRHTDVTQDEPGIPDSAWVSLLAKRRQLVPNVLSTGRAPGTVVAHGTEWAVLQQLAKRNDFEATVEFDSIYFGPPRPQLSAIVLQYRENLTSFSPRFTPSTKAAQTQVRASNTQSGGEPVVAQASPAQIAAGGNDVIHRLVASANSTGLQEAVERVISTTNATSFSEAQKIATAAVRQATNEMLEGRGSCPGEPALRAGRTVQIKGVGDTFSGRYRLSQVEHSISSSGYETSFSISSPSVTSVASVVRTIQSEESSPGQPSPVYGLVIADVLSTSDPANLGRVKLQLPDFAGKSQTALAPLATFAAGNNAGGWFIPQPGDQVVVSFLRGDVSKPVVLGSLWSMKRRPPASDTIASVLQIEGDLTIEASGVLSMVGDESITIRSGGKVNVETGQTMDVNNAN